MSDDGQDATPAAPPPAPTNDNGAPGGEPPMDVAPPSAPSLPEPFDTEGVNAGRGPYDPIKRPPRG
jgi:hypothetical protein